MTKSKIKTAIIDLYNNERNEGMRCIKEILSDASTEDIEVDFKVYESRFKGDVPGTDYDIYISSGGPGSPFEGEGKKWEKDYFDLVDSIWNHNQKNEKKKYIFFICHSFQMMARHFKFADVTERKIKSFGVLPMAITDVGKNDNMLHGLTDPFYAADFRQFQVINKNENIFNDLNASLLSVEYAPEKKSDELALMAVRLSDEIAGTQFHPEADPESMIYHLKQEERKKHIVDNYGEEKYFEMIDLLEDPAKIKLTRKTVIPSFLRESINSISIQRSNGAS
jgi:homoserine O-succinyltransferase/O-acetyltransferase